ncbi:MAG: AarF/ABC1/UbiB kinase family protein, partial [Myxococcota bacterium]
MLGTAAKNLARLRRITAVLGKYGYGELVRRGDSGDASASDKVVEGSSPGPRRFRQMLEELGPTFIKFGQVLSTRPDLVSKPYLDELKTLQDHCETLDFTTIRR